MEKPSAVLVLRSGREKPVLNRHPWLFSGAVERVEGPTPVPGDLIAVTSRAGEPLATAYYNPKSQIVARILSWDPDEPIDERFWGRRIEQARALRRLLSLEPATTAYRLISGEADGLPGLIVDSYGPFLITQCLTLGIDRRKEMLVSLLAEIFQPKGIYERSDVSVRKKEGLPLSKGVLWGESPPEQVRILEHGLPFQVDVHHGHKTGFYLDQRDNRARVSRPALVAGRDVLNVFAYTGGFAVYAAAAGARSIVNVDDSKDALALASRNVANAHGTRPEDEYITGDAFQILRQFRDHGKLFDFVVLDPPKFAHSRRDVDAACRGYKDLNWLAMRLLRPNGLLATFSCSGRVSADLFQKVVFAAAVDAGRTAQVLQPLAQSADHPVLLTFPESSYLKGFLCRVI